MNEFLDLIQEFENKPNLCNWFRLHAYDTWRRIEFARNQWGLRIFETTITQNILYQFTLYKQLRSLPVEMYEAVDEGSNGNDIEFEYHFGNGVLKLPMQAKIIYGNGYYPRMEHGSQIETLIDYAKREGGYPLYILYNYWTNVDFTLFNNQTDCGVAYDIHQYGISLTSAYHLERTYYNQRLKRDGTLAWNIPTFNDLHPKYAIPWFMLVCCNDLRSQKDFVDLLDPSKHPDRSIHTKNLIIRSIEQTDLKKWKPLELEKFIGERQLERKEYEEIRMATTQSISEENTVDEKKYYREYNPKYKIVLHKN